MFKTTLPLLAATLLVVGCSEPTEPTATEPASPATAADVKREAGEALETARSFAAGKQAEYTQAIESQLAELTTEAQDLRTRAAVAGDEARAQAEEWLAQLDQQLADAQQKLVEMKNSSTNTVEAVKEGFDNVLAEIKRSTAKIRETLE